MIPALIQASKLLTRNECLQLRAICDEALMNSKYPRGDINNLIRKLTLMIRKWRGKTNQRHNIVEGWKNIMR